MDAIGYIEHRQQSGAGMRVKVCVLGLRRVFGRLEYRVTPVAGDGELWVHASSIVAWAVPPAPAEVAA